MAIYDGKRLVHRNHITESEDVAKQDDQIVDSIVRNLLQGEWDTISAMEADLSFVKEAKADQVVIDALVHVLEEEYEHVGIYTKLLQDRNPSAESIEDGHDEMQEINDKAEEEPETKEEIEEAADGTYSARLYVNGALVENITGCESYEEAQAAIRN